MAAARGGEVEDLITCPICLCEYDDVIENRKPKFLSCSHTVCLQCLKGLQNSFLVSCPLCRKILCPTGTLDIASVPTNTYALCILKLSKAQRKPAEPVKKVTKPNWCFTCGSIGKIDCPTLHSTMDMTAHTMSNFEALLAVKDHYARVKEPLRSKLESAIEKEKELQSYLDKIFQALKSLETDILKSHADSQSRLREMIFLMESRFIATRSKEEENDAFLSELFSLGNSSQTLETLKKNLESSFKEIETSLNSSENVSELPDLVNSTRIAVKLFSEDSSTLPCPEFLEKGFTSNWKTVNKCTDDQLLLSHLIFTLRNQLGFKSTAIQNTPILAPLIPAPTIPLPIQFNPDKFKFVLTLKHSRTIKGQVHIRPIINQCQNFAQNLGEFCFSKSRALIEPVGKAVHEVYVSIPLSMSGFQTGFTPAKGALSARKPLDVGLLLENGNQSLIFMLDKCLMAKYDQHVKPLKAALLFGVVVAGQDALVELSATSMAIRSGYTFTLEAQNIM